MGLRRCLESRLDFLRTSYRLSRNDLLCQRSLHACQLRTALTAEQSTIDFLMFTLWTGDHVPSFSRPGMSSARVPYLISLSPSFEYFLFC